MSEPALHLDGQVHLGQGRLQLISFQGPAMSPTVSETDPGLTKEATESAGELLA